MSDDEFNVDDPNSTNFNHLNFDEIPKFVIPYQADPLKYKGSFNRLAKLSGDTILYEEIKILRSIIENQADFIDNFDVLENRAILAEDMTKLLQKKYDLKVCSYRKRLKKVGLKNKELKEQIVEMKEQDSWGNSYEGGRP